MNKKYIYNEESGELEEYKAKSTPDFEYAIFILDEDDDTLNYIGKAPILFRNMKELSTYIKSKSFQNEMAEWLAAGQRVVIDRLDIYST